MRYAAIRQNELPKFTKFATWLNADCWKDDARPLRREDSRMLPMTFEAIPTVDPERPLQALSLPAWLQRCVNAATADFSPTIPAELALSEEQRAAVVVLVEELDNAEMACDVDHTMTLVVALLDAFPAAKLSEDQARSKAKGYITALEGVPTGQSQKRAVDGYRQKQAHKITISRRPRHASAKYQMRCLRTCARCGLICAGC